LDNGKTALADYNDALKLNPKHINAYYNRGLTYNRLKEDQKAIADYDQSIKLNPQFADAYFNRGLTHYRLGQDQKAIADLKKAAELFKNQGKTDLVKKAETVLQKIQAS
jgi:tetratricopeptide (TPR) repeat protein